MLKSKYNWKNGAMANEYIDASIPTMKRNAEMLTGVTVEKKPKIEEKGQKGLYVCRVSFKRLFFWKELLCQYNAKHV